MKDIALSRFDGFADVYDRFRPQPPKDIALLLLDISGCEKAGTVVDLGCGTGLSTRIWSGMADTIIGIEPNDDMRKKAEESTTDHTINFIKGSSYDTGLSSESADIVTCAQSFHWMEPVTTLKEVSRILKKSGVFCVFDNEWPPFVSPECDKAYEELFEAVKKLTAQNLDILPREIQYPKSRHFENLKNSGYFFYCKEIFLHNIEECDCERFLNLAMSQGSLQTLVKNGINNINGHIEKYKMKINDYFTSRKKNNMMWVVYKLRIGII